MINSIETLLRDYRKTLDSDVKSLVELHEKDSGTQGRPGRWLQAIARSSVVLLGANTENYIESLVCEGLQYLADNKVKARRYPENFRLWIFREEIHMRSLSITDARDVTELSMKLWSDVRELPTEELKLESLKESFANPTPKNVNWIMSLLDRDSYLSDVAVTVDGASISGEAGLGELAARRNKIAHGNKDEKPSIQDVRRLTKFCQLFANRLKKDVESTVSSCLPYK